MVLVGLIIRRVIKPSLEFSHRKFSIFPNCSSMCTDAKKMKTDVLKIGTHSGTFHCDEILACSMLKQLPKYKDAEIVRSRSDEVLKECDIVVDVGGVFDAEKNLFDHHQRSFSETFSSLRPELGDKYNIKLSSAGLVYTYFGEDVIANVLKNQRDITLSDEHLKTVYLKLYDSLIREIDAIDNGVPISQGEQLYSISTSLSKRVGRLNPEWDCEEYNETELFENAMKLVEKEFIERVIFFGCSWLKARQFVEEAVANAKNVYKTGEILVMSRFCPWEHHFAEIEKANGNVGEAKYLLFPDKSDWRVRCIPQNVGSFVCRKYLHKDWRGLREAELASLSGIPDTIFCHATGFIGGARSKEGALQMAIKSLEGDYSD